MSRKHLSLQRVEFETDVILPIRKHVFNKTVVFTGLNNTCIKETKQKLYLSYLVREGNKKNVKVHGHKNKIFGRRQCCAHGRLRFS